MSFNDHFLSIPDTVLLEYRRQRYEHLRQQYEHLRQQYELLPKERKDVVPAYN